MLSLSGINSLQSRGLGLSSQVQLLPHLSCHRCSSGRKFTASDGGPGHPANCFLSDGGVGLCCQHRVALGHLALQMQWGRKEPLTAPRGCTVHKGEGPTFTWDPGQPSRPSPLPHNCSGTEGQIRKLSLPLTPSKKKGTVIT